MVERISTYTEISRADNVVDVLDQHVLPQLAYSHLNVGVIGLGLSGDVVCCPYEAPYIAAYLEANYIPYSMTCIDRDENVISDLKMRNKLVISEDDYADDVDRVAWEKYLGRTVVEDTLVTDADPDFMLSDSYRELLRYEGRSVSNLRARSAPLPETFIEKRKFGGVAILCADISDPVCQDRIPSGHHFVSCMNVLYYIPPLGQSRAFSLLSKMTRPGGYVLWNDGHSAYGDFVMSENLKGWLKEEQLYQEFGFNIVAKPKIPFIQYPYLMQKVAEVATPTSSTL